MSGPDTDRLTEALSWLQAKGERLTAARRAILTVLDSTAEHLTADEIAHRAANLAPGVHRATTYRTLTTLGELGLVTHTHVPGSGTIYHLAKAGAGHPTPSHAHVQCTSCNRIIDVDEASLRQVGTALRDEIGFHVDVHHAAFLGTCADCIGAE